MEETINRLKIILDSKHVEPAYRERSRQQLIHITWEGDKQACPCRDCVHHRNFPSS